MFMLVNPVASALAREIPTVAFRKAREFFYRHGGAPDERCESDTPQC